MSDYFDKESELLKRLSHDLGSYPGQEALPGTERVMLVDLEDPFRTPFLMQFDDGEVIMKLHKPQTDSAFEPGRELVAKVEFNGNGVLAGVEETGGWIFLLGASARGEMGDNELGVLAKDHRFIYRVIKGLSAVSYPDESEEKLQAFKNEIASLRELGLVRYEGGFEIQAKLHEGLFVAPPLRQILYGHDDVRQLFAD